MRLAFRSAALIAALSLMAGCAWFKPKEEKRSAEQMWQDGERYFSEQEFEKAADDYKKLRDYHPYSPLTTMAELKLADAYFLDKKYQQAYSQYDQFRELHPTNEKVSYAIYQMGMCHFKQMQSQDRDQDHTRAAVKEFIVLIRMYPGSEYITAARDKLEQCWKRLAQNDFYIGKFYYKQGNYHAALRRFERIRDLYSGLGLDWSVDSYIDLCQKAIARKNEKEKERANE
jgi:outer membrane protein assembly factor BamD